MAGTKIAKQVTVGGCVRLVKIVASLALLWAGIDLAEGEDLVRRNLARHGTEQLAESDNEGGVADVTRMLDTLQARAE